MLSDILVRRATADDIGAIRDLYKTHLGKYSYCGVATLTDVLNTTMVAEYEGKVIGAVSMDSTGACAVHADWVCHGIAVKSRFRRKGVAEKLLKAVLTLVKGRILFLARASNGKHRANYALIKNHFVYKESRAYYGCHDCSYKNKEGVSCSTCSCMIYSLER